MSGRDTVHRRRHCTPTDKHFYISLGIFSKPVLHPKSKLPEFNFLKDSEEREREKMRNFLNYVVVLVSTSFRKVLRYNLWGEKKNNNKNKEENRRWKRTKMFVFSNKFKRFKEVFSGWEKKVASSASSYDGKVGDEYGRWNNAKPLILEGTLAEGSQRLNEGAGKSSGQFVPKIKK